MNRLIFLLALGLWSGSATAADWPSWRGPNGDGTTPEKQFPTQWDRTRNVRWRVDLPEPGNSSPIVVGRRVFLTQATDDGRRRGVICYDRATGRQLWQAGVEFEGKETTHETNPFCSASPVSDGRIVIASFASAGVVGFDLEGKELWRTDLGPQKHTWGQGSSPILFEDLCILYHGPGTPSTLYALEKKTGKVRWQVNIPEVHPAERFDGFAGKNDGMMGSFATPMVIRADRRHELLLPVANKLRAYDPKTGRELWVCDGLNPLVYSSTTFANGWVVAMGGFFGSTMVVRPGGSGDVTASHRLWHEQRAKKHRICTPIVRDGHIYVYNTIGIAECIDLKTGKTVWEERIAASGPKGESWSSFVLVDDKLFGVNQSGDTVVLRAAPKFELLATNPLGELSNSTPAFSNGEIFIRTHKSLWCISSESRAAAARR